MTRLILFALSAILFLATVGCGKSGKSKEDTHCEGCGCGKRAVTQMRSVFQDRESSFYWATVNHPSSALSLASGVFLTPSKSNFESKGLYRIHSGVDNIRRGRVEQVALMSDNQLLVLDLGGFRKISFDGALDETFHPEREGGSVFAIQSDGKILGVRHQGNYESSLPATVFRLNADGRIDATFGIGGEVSVGSFNHVAFVAQVAGEVVVGGSKAGQGAFISMGRDGTKSELSEVGDYRIWPGPQRIVAKHYVAKNMKAFFADGKLDTAFGNHGEVSLEREYSAHEMTKNGEILLAGKTESGVEIVRYSQEGRIMETKDIKWSGVDDVPVAFDVHDGGIGVVVSNQNNKAYSCIPPSYDSVLLKIP